MPAPDPFAAWRNKPLDTANDLTVETEVGAVRVRRMTADVGSATTWSLAIQSAATCEVRRDGWVGVVNRWLRLTRTHPTISEANFRGDPKLAVAVATSEVAAVLSRWRRYTLAVTPSELRLAVPTSNVDATEARAGVAVVSACALAVRSGASLV
ncbi:MAG: hypothetical protein ACKV2T_07945 [Kofleriaceae bacterium]